MDAPYTLVQLRIAHALLERARTRLGKLRALHDKEVDQLSDEIHSCASEAQARKLQARWEALHDRGRRLTLHNVIRVAIEFGILDMDAEEALEKIAEEGTPLGRPRRVTG